MSERPSFSSNLGAVLSMLGVAVGLGNVWRFPYMMGRYGGSAFLLVYLAFVCGLAIPALSAEWAFGRATRKGPVGAFTDAFGPRVGRGFGIVLLFGILVANSYYLVIISNCAYTAYFSLVHGFSSETIPALQEGLARGPLQYAIGLAILLASVGVLHLGLRRGIERASKIFIPFFGLVVVYLVFHALTLDGALARLREFLRPDFSLIGPEQAFAAMGQAAFSVGLGGTLMLGYGSYLAADQPIIRTAVATGLGDAGAALLAALFVVPTVLVFGLDLTSGPTLLFTTLPELFRVMPGGRPLGTLFLLALALVAFLSSLAALEVFVGDLGRRWSRSRLLGVVLLVEAGLMLPSALDPSRIATLDLIFGSGMMVLGSALALIAVTWGLGMDVVLGQLVGSRRDRIDGIYFNWLRWVVPAALLAILAGYIHSSFS